MDPKVIEWDGTHLPEALRKFPAGRYAIEPIDQLSPLSEDEERGIMEGLNELDAGRGISLADVLREIRSSVYASDDHCRRSEGVRPFRGVVMEIFPGISMDPGIRFGKPCLTGTRIDVATVVGALAAEETFEVIQEAYQITPGTDSCGTSLMLLMSLNMCRRRSPYQMQEITHE